ncbi:MAG: hypothetical protein HY530_02760 [Chloroflexi bacterium]|nr:hypothetical protein [Chloroflexota bacterium]
MIISITSSKVNPEQAPEVEKFLQEFLPRFKREPGVIAIYHYKRPEKGDEATIVIWGDEKSLKRYREGVLIKEPIAFEQKLGLQTTREAYPLVLALK